MKGLQVVSLLFGLVFILVLIGLPVYGYVIGYQYERDIGSYMSNAVDMVAPEAMLGQVQLSKQAMIDAGLNEDDYGAWIFKKPSNSMKFQYQHLDSIEERINAVIIWKKQTYGVGSTNTESLGDVYEQKMTNLRNYINGETSDSIGSARSDWIAEDAWWLKNHFMLKVFGLWIWLLILILAIICFFIAGFD